eukprot:Rhum_TRINITY_DN23025_c0_g1::Rhum_TRINITY_DN23025_c0_g1_i1::g.176870::m.176870
MMKTAAALLLACGSAAASELIEKVHEQGTGLCDPQVKQYTGYHKLDTGDKHYFYWAFESRHVPATDPFVLWMTGGPGCSSELALFEENGPCKVNNDSSGTTPNPYGWNNNATLLYVDQPTGTGFSYGWARDTSSQIGVANDMYDFLQLFFKQHPEYQARKFFVYGESYGGHFVPAVTHKILLENENLKAGNVKINLHGTSIGNGLVDPLHQYSHYPDMAASDNGHTPALGKAEVDLMRAAVPSCLAGIKACYDGIPVSCFAALEECNLALIIPYSLSGRNTYDMRKKCTHPPLCYDFSHVKTYMNLPAVQKQLGVDRHWTPCDKTVTLPMEGDWMHNYEIDLPAQLAAGIRVQIYAGDQDYICNWLGNKAWSLAMPWPGQSGFNASADKPWMLDGAEAAKIRSYQNFSFVQVHNAGHMVPMDQPKFALEMLNRFIHQ